jgi:exopolysaccharide biosynthesis polyprenyl glycosylphosphotransferase
VASLIEREQQAEPVDGAVPEPGPADGLLARVGGIVAIRPQRSRPEIREAREARASHGGRRGWLIRRLLVAADLCGLATAFVITDAMLGLGARLGEIAPALELLIFLATLPVWILMAKLYGLYDRDEERTDHSTIDELAGVFHVVSLGVWLVFAVGWLTHAASPDPTRLLLFWALAILLVTVARATARAIAHRSESFQQRALIVGGGDVGQLVARKLLQHPEYGITLVGVVDERPKERRDDISSLPLLGRPAQLPELVTRHGIDREIDAFSNASHAETLGLVRSLDDRDVQIDLVPRLFELVGPRASLHTVEGLPLVGLSPVRLSPSARMMKRTVDVIGAVVGLTVAAPLFLYAAWRIRRESPGAMLFRQTRLGLNGQEFTMLKFRTMHLNTDQQAHRDYIKSISDAKATPQGNGLYKLDRSTAIFPFGQWLRKTSLDEVPQLINVLRGEMSLVGPRPCLAYEVEHFAPHHMERFAVPPGMTGLWQVTARAHSTFAEALDMDVSYVRGWSLGLDLSLLCRTPLQIFTSRGTA